MTTVLVTQPGYWPHVHLVSRALAADTVVLLGSAQHTKKSPVPGGGQMPTRQASCVIVGPGGPLELTVPCFKGRKPIDDINIVEDGWRERHLRSVEHAYAKAPFGADAWHLVRYTLADPSDSLGELTRMTWQRTIASLRTATHDVKVLRDQAVIKTEDVGSDWMLDIAMLTGDVYLCGRSAYENYLNVSDFDACGIEVRVHSFNPKPWPQRAPGFIADVSILDLVANVGWNQARSILVG